MQEQLDYEDSLRRQLEEGKREAGGVGAGVGPGGSAGGEKGFLSLMNKVDLNRWVCTRGGGGEKRVCYYIS